ncbi:FHA domain-containing protein [Xylophilus sp. GOD-11R]|uniref:FHA domain-containing protein n=1 Tax=Xylophilus sp. GOD-11R TaxID=3089814 RepID=UPI00298CFB98|nr:FHA domain-containing protein [Xylophilus sp. GOD-11R]WPB56872.1 FHA domain-containing protein [Xylophilus sp. GOD-11R]
MLLSLEGVALREIVLTKEYTTFGRRPYSDVVIDNLAVSGEHAAVRRVGNDMVVEDLNSTNGTFVNGRPTRRQVLRSGDVVEIGRYQLHFEAAAPGTTMEPSEPAPAEDFSYSSIPPFSHSEMAPTFFPETAMAGDVPPALSGSIRVLSGAAAGKSVDLVKVVTTIGKAGVGVASITRRQHGFSLAHVEGAAVPTVNGTLVGNAPVMLRHGDTVELAGIRMQFVQGTA